MRNTETSDRVKRVADAVRHVFERTRPLWLLYLAFVAFMSAAVLAARYPRIRAVIERVNEWISSS